MMMISHHPISLCPLPQLTLSLYKWPLAVGAVEAISAWDKAAKQLPPLETHTKRPHHHHHIKQLKQPFGGAPSSSNDASCPGSILHK